MAAEIKRPGEYGHNNTDKAFTDADAVRGGGRVVADRAALYALASKSDQLKQRVTRVWLESEAVTLVLTDATKIGETGGWKEETAGLARFIGAPGDINIIVDGGNSANTIGGGTGITGLNLIQGGEGNTIPDGYANSIYSSVSCTVQGNFNTVIGGDGCLIPDTCQYITLIGCSAALVLAAGTERKTYVNNALVSGLPAYDPATDEGKVLTIVGGIPQWSDGGTGPTPTYDTFTELA